MQEHLELVQGEEAEYHQRKPVADGLGVQREHNAFDGRSGEAA